MCGVTGFIGAANQAADAPDIVARMLAPLAPRGPDASGSWIGGGPGRTVALGHRRLSILDLSDAAGQPMVRGEIALVHNGEIYNFVELRRELEDRGHQFWTTSDTEVVIAAYCEWGHACVERFNGMFAFALWDGAKGQLFCARDRMGEKPFYYHGASSALVFGSEIKAVLGYGAPVPRTFDPARIAAFIEASWQEQYEQSFFVGIRELLPAHTLVVEVVDGAVRWRCARYWRYPDPVRGDPPTAAELLELFDDSVRLRLRSDVPIGTSLSGGVDSPSVVGSIRAQDPGDAMRFRYVGIHAYADAEGCDERNHVAHLAEQLDVRVDYVQLTGAGCAAELDDLILRQEEPFLGPSIYAQRCVFRRAAELGLTVMLDGQGADELFGGYDWAVPKALAAVWREAGMRAMGRCLKPFDRQRFPRQRLLTQILLSRLRGAQRGLPDDLYAALRAAVTSLSLPSLLRYADRNSMTFGIETRLPFLDHRLIEASVRLRAEDFIRGGRTKGVLREAMAERVPAQILERVDKTAFAVPEVAWLRGELRESVREAAADPLWRDVPGGTGFCRRALGELEGRPYARAAWKVLCVSRWHQRFFRS